MDFLPNLQTWGSSLIDSYVKELIHDIYFGVWRMVWIIAATQLIHTVIKDLTVLNLYVHEPITLTKAITIAI